MMFKSKIIPIVITACISAVLLFGGWNLYRGFAVEKPLEQLARDLPGVEAAHPVVGQSQITLELALAADANLREIYQVIKEEGKKAIGAKELQLQVNGSGNEQLNQIWSTVLFQVAEAMETRQYSQIPAALSELSAAHEGLSASTEMDESNVYITLRIGEDAKFVVLPRQPAKLGVWANA